MDDPGDVCLMELWYDCRGLCCAVGYGPGFTGAGPNGIAGYFNYYGAGTVPIENGETELDSGDVREKLNGGDPIVSLQTFVPGLRAGTIQPVGGTDKFLPLLGRMVAVKFGSGDIAGNGGRDTSAAQGFWLYPKSCDCRRKTAAFRQMVCR